METKLCPNCREEFQQSHGNRKYCSDDCYKENKRIEQKENNKIIKEFKQGFLRNYELFLRLLPKAGRISMQLHKLLKPGFDQYAFYGIVIDNDKNRWYKVNDYLFTIIQKDGSPILNLQKRL